MTEGSPATRRCPPPDSLEGGEVLLRFGDEYEDDAMLEGQAHHALHVLGIHGVSMTAGDPAAARGALERYGFPVHDTPTRRNRHHKTVELPHPVDHEAGDRFNCILGRER